MKNDSTKTNSILVMFALIAAFGLVTVVAVDIILTAQEADAVKPPTQGCRNSVAVNASQGRCFQG
jgi:Flp pilus assembly protein CpaB